MASIFRQISRLSHIARDAAIVGRTAVAILDKITELADVASGRRAVEPRDEGPIRVDFKRDPKTGEYVGVYEGEPRR